MASSTPDFSSRVVVFASTGHHLSDILPKDYMRSGSLAPYNNLSGYWQSKTANIYVANEIDRRYGSKGLHRLSVHPGNILEPNSAATRKTKRLSAPHLPAIRCYRR